MEARNTTGDQRPSFGSEDQVPRPKRASPKLPSEASSNRREREVIRIRKVVLVGCVTPRRESTTRHPGLTIGSDVDERQHKGCEGKGTESERRRVGEFAMVEGERRLRSVERVSTARRDDGQLILSTPMRRNSTPHTRLRAGVAESLFPFEADGTHPGVTARERSAPPGPPSMNPPFSMLESADILYLKVGGGSWSAR